MKIIVCVLKFLITQMLQMYCLLKTSYDNKIKMVNLNNF